MTTTTNIREQILDLDRQITAEVAKYGRATTQRAQTMSERRLRNLRLDKGRLETAEIVVGGECPQCGSAIRRNLALPGWYQCEQYGDGAFRARPDDPQCSWQGFTS